MTLAVRRTSVERRRRRSGALPRLTNHFGPGLAAEWPHLAECIRVSYAQPDAVLAAGFAAIAEELRTAWLGRDAP